MFKLKILSVLLFFSLVLFTASSCSDDDDGDNTNNEFVADAGTFDGFLDWLGIGFTKGPSANLGPAHAGNDSNATRWIFLKDPTARITDGNYPKGTVIVKTVLDKDGNQIGLTAMVKRGGDFNKDFGGWEWFMWDDQGTMMRGADLGDGMCNNCHAGAASMDYVFSDPEGFEVSEMLFDDYESWPVIKVLQGQDPTLGAAHEGNDSTTTRTVRFVSENLKADNDGSYPYGSRMIKEIKDKDGNLIGLTAMVKQGGDFNPVGGGWYWYRWVVEDGEVKGIMVEGVVDGCNGCHAQAANLDFVFTVNN